MITHVVFHTFPAMFHVAAGRGCARVVHAAIDVAAEYNVYNIRINHRGENEHFHLPRKVVT